MAFLMLIADVGKAVINRTLAFFIASQYNMRTSTLDEFLISVATTESAFIALTLYFDGKLSRNNIIWRDCNRISELNFGYLYIRIQKQISSGVFEIPLEPARHVLFSRRKASFTYSFYRELLHINSSEK